MRWKTTRCASWKNPDEYRKTLLLRSDNNHATSRISSGCLESRPASKYVIKESWKRKSRCVIWIDKIKCQNQFKQKKGLEINLFAPNFVAEVSVTSTWSVISISVAFLGIFLVSGIAGFKEFCWWLGRGYWRVSSQRLGSGVCQHTSIHLTPSNRHAMYQTNVVRVLCLVFCIFTFRILAFISITQC